MAHSWWAFGAVLGAADVVPDAMPVANDAVLDAVVHADAALDAAPDTADTVLDAAVHAAPVVADVEHVGRVVPENPLERLQLLRRPTMIIPFLPGISGILKTIATDNDVQTWYTYPGKLLDQFNQHRCRVHVSKRKYSVYCTQCICGLQYVGESNRNLKVCLAEHLYRSSRSAFTFKENLSIQWPFKILQHWQKKRTT